MEHITLLVLSASVYTASANSMNYYQQFLSKSAKLNNTQIRNLLDGQCKSTRQGDTYTGNQSYSISGEKCLSWESSRIHGKIRSMPAYNHNYCRNPNNNSEGPWCHTENSKHGEICPIPLCKTSVTHNVLYIEKMKSSITKMNGLKAAEAIVIYGFPCFIILGTVFNICSIAVFRRPSMRGSTTSILFILLAIADVLTLYLLTIPTWVPYVMVAHAATSY